MDERQALLDLVAAIDPFDALEQKHRDETLAWIGGGAPIWRTDKPATPPEHLVSYALLVDLDAQSVLLADHRKSGLWLPPGGHVDPGEPPAAAATRELDEELGVQPKAIIAEPFFVTRTSTVNETPSHLDVSLWFLFAGTVGMHLTPDRREFAEVRWWPFADSAGPRFDPHLPRCVAKIERQFTSRSRPSQ